MKFEDHGWGKPGLYCEGYCTGARKKGEINLLDAEDLNHHVETVKTLTDSEHEDDQAKSRAGPGQVQGKIFRGPGQIPLFPNFLDLVRGKSGANF